MRYPCLKIMSVFHITLSLEASFVILLRISLKVVNLESRSSLGLEKISIAELFCSVLVSEV